jgi:lysophospholipase L1-like esterase
MEIANMGTILTIGDSVPWGQGLLEVHKFDTIVAEETGRALVRLAHSGALLGRLGIGGGDTAIDGEIPVPSPTAAEQIAGYDGYQEVDLVLLSGGINDVDIRSLVNPSVNVDTIMEWTDEACLHNMQDILLDLDRRLTHPKAIVLVIGYYPIFSSASGIPAAQIQGFLEIHGVASSAPILGPQWSLSSLTGAVIERCEAFWRTSDAALNQAVDACNEKILSDRFRFVRLPFTADNALFAPHSLLWELSPTLDPEDEARDARAKVSEAMYGDLLHLPQWIQCVHASVGHPNIDGAALIATTILNALG